MSTLVSIRNLTKSYQRGPEKVDVLHGLDLDIAAGDFVALMGPSGSGKTTLLNLIGGLDAPSSGEIGIAGQRIDRMGQVPRHRGRMGQQRHATPLQGGQQLRLGQQAIKAERHGSSSTKESGWWKSGLADRWASAQ